MVLGSRQYTIRKKYFRKWVITWEHVQDKGNGELCLYYYGSQRSSVTMFTKDLVFNPIHGLMYRWQTNEYTLLVGDFLFGLVFVFLKQVE